MRICFELLDLLKAHKKGIRRAAVNSFGYIAKVSLHYDPTSFYTHVHLDSWSSRRFVCPAYQSTGARAPESRV
jgi:hypothetical protein